MMGNKGTYLCGTKNPKAHGGSTFEPEPPGYHLSGLIVLVIAPPPRAPVLTFPT